VDTTEPNSPVRLDLFASRLVNAEQDRDRLTAEVDRLRADRDRLAAVRDRYRAYAQTLAWERSDLRQTVRDLTVRYRAAASDRDYWQARWVSAVDADRPNAD